MVLVHLGFGDGVSSNRLLDRAEAQRIHHRHWPGAHGEDVSQNAADSGCGALEWLDERRMVKRFDLEGAGPSITDIDDAGSLAGALHHATAAGGKSFQMHARRLVRAMLAPQHAEYAQL